MTFSSWWSWTLGALAHHLPILSFNFLRLFLFLVFFFFSLIFFIFLCSFLFLWRENKNKDKSRGREGRAGGPAVGVWGGAEQSILYPQGDQREQGTVIGRVPKGPGPRETSHNGVVGAANGSIKTLLVKMVSANKNGG